MKTITPYAVALLLLALPAAALADDMNGMAMSGGGPADKAFAQSMQTMMKDMGTKPTGHPDTDFATMMIPHHQGAIDMAKAELQYGKDPELRSLAQTIVKAQETEIAGMKDWLAKHGR